LSPGREEESGGAWGLAGSPHPGGSVMSLSRKTPASRLNLEALEDRQLMAAGLTTALQNGVLTLTGTSAHDKITPHQQNGQITIDGMTGSCAVAKLKQIVINGLDGNDTISLFDGTQAVSVPCVILGGTGNDAIFGGAGNDVIRGGDDNDYIDGGAGEDVL